MNLRIIAQFLVLPENRADFVSFIEAGTKSARLNEPDDVLTYDWFWDPEDETRAVVHETYRDRHAFERHLGIFGAAIEAATASFEIDRMIMIGDAGAEIVEQMQMFAGPKFHYYGKVQSLL